jgi:hypothetical protein
MRESRLDDNARKLVAKLGGRWEKLPPTRGSSYRPDRLLLFRGKVPVYIELKRPGQRPTDGQFAMLNRLQDAGFHAFWFNNWELLRQFIHSVANSRPCN